MLNRHAYRSFHANAGDPQDTILRPTLFIIFINDLPDVIPSQKDIYVDDITVYCSFTSKSERAEKTALMKLNQFALAALKFANYVLAASLKNGI